MKKQANKEKYKNNMENTLEIRVVIIGVSGEVIDMG